MGNSLDSSSKALTRAGSLVYDPLALICSFAIPLALALEACTFIGTPFGNNELMVPEYWFTVISIAYTLVWFIFFIMAFGMAGLGMMTFALVLTIIGAAWQLFMVIYWIVLLVTCDSSTQCADNVDCTGAVVGVYSGPTSRFIASLVGIIVMFFVKVMAIAAEFHARKLLLSAKATLGTLMVTQYASTRREHSERKVEAEALRAAREKEQTTTTISQVLGSGTGKNVYVSAKGKDEADE